MGVGEGSLFHGQPDPDELDGVSHGEGAEAGDGAAKEEDESVFEGPLSFGIELSPHEVEDCKVLRSRECTMAA